MSVLPPTALASDPEVNAGTGTETPPADLITKDPRSFKVAPHLLDREAACREFRWAHARQALAGLPGGALNIAHEAVGRHAQGARADHVAIRWLGADGTRQTLTYRELDARASRFANVLVTQGLQRGDLLFVLMPRVPELYVAVLGALKAGLAVAPLYPAFGPEPVAARIEIAGGRALITTPELYRKKVASVRSRLATLTLVFVSNSREAQGEEPPDGTLDLKHLMDKASPVFETVATRPEDMALLHFTSGTTGRPKGAVHVHEAVLTHWATGRHALDLHEDDIFWCTADPGWVTGMSYGVITPLLHGVTMVVDEADFDPLRWYTILQDEGVSVWYTAPTAVRMLMKAGAQAAARFRFPALRFIASVGEPLNPQAVRWGQQVLGLPIHDNWWQTETGGIMIANTVAQPIKPGSMGRPLPGVEALVVQRQEGGAITRAAPGEQGELALRAGWPSMFRGYLGDEARYRKCFAELDGVPIYLSGDVVRCDAEGDYWFVGRADDVIKSAGHLIGPFEVESTLMGHPGVVEAAVIGKPDPLLGEIVKAFVTLRPGVEPTETLHRELLARARVRLGPAVAPRELEFRPALPHTRSGKIMRRLLKARECGLPEGDLSTLEAS